jgi:TPR repeat protein
MSNNDEAIKEINNLLVKDEYDKALELLKPLVEKNVPVALGLMGLVYQLGWGVERNGKEAVKYFEKAIELGDGGAAHNLGTLYISDVPGVTNDPVKSKYYYRLAKKMGAQFANDEWYE